VERMLRKKFAGQGNRVYEESAEAIATGKTLDSLSSFFLVHHHAMVIL